MTFKQNSKAKENRQLVSDFQIDRPKSSDEIKTVTQVDWKITVQSNGQFQFQ